MLCICTGSICMGSFSDDEAPEYVQLVHASWFGEAYRAYSAACAVIALVGKRVVRTKEEPCHWC